MSLALVFLRWSTLMAALYGMGVDNALVEVDQGEIPILDGSSKNLLKL